MNKSLKTVVFWIVILVSAMLLWQVVRSNGPNNRQDPEISYSQFMTDVEAGKVAGVAISGTQIRGRYRDGNRPFHLTGPSDPKVFLSTLQQKGVEVSFRDAANPSGPLQILGTWAPLILIAAFWFLLIRQLRKRGQRPPSPPSSNAPINPV